MSALSAFLSPDFLFRNAILGGLGVALLCSLLGIYLVLRRLVLIGVALPQAGAAGIAAAFWLTGHAHEGASSHLLALGGSAFATFASLALLVTGRRGGRSPAEWAVGALFAICSAATVLFVALDPKGDLEMSSLLRGELLAMSDTDLWVVGGALVAVGGLFLLFRRELLLAAFDPEFARTLGRNPLRADALLYGLLGGSIALGVMETGPLVVFGFLVLPALAALRVAPSILAAFVLSAGVAAVSFLGGFALAYRADLPAGPVSVALAAGLWLAATLGARLARRRRRAGALAVLLIGCALLAPPGCAARPGAREPASTALPRGTLPEGLGRPITVLPFANATGQALQVPQGFVRDVAQAVGDPFAEPNPTVPQLLQQRAAFELTRRGFEVAPVAPVLAALPRPPEDPLAAARAARRAGFAGGAVLAGRLGRFTITNTGLLLVRLDLWLVDPERDTVIWSGSARRPVPIRSALTWQEILLDAGGPIFAEAFGSS